MQRRVSLAHLLFPALWAAVLVSLVLGLSAGLLLHSRFGEAFPELGLPGLLLYAVGRAGRLLVPAAAMLAVLPFLLLLPLNVSRLRKRLRVIDRPLAFYTALFTMTAFIFCGIFYVNSNLLRFSREPRAYAADSVVIVVGLMLFATILRIWPSARSRVASKGMRIAALVASLLILAVSLAPNPFALSRHLPPSMPPVAPDYDSQGRYLGSEQVVPPSWNVILLSIDTLRSDGLGCYGNPRPTSPNIDKLAAQGVRFTYVLAQSSWTLPSHMTMFTGLYPSVHGCTTPPSWNRTIDRLDETWITLPEVLRGWGYATVAYTDGRMVGPTFGFDQGFDVCDDSGGGIVRVVEKARSWLERHSGDRPFFLFLHAYDVHHYRPPEEYERLFVRPYDGPLRALRRSGNDLEIRVTSDGFYSLSAEDIRYLRDLYDAEICKTDAAFGGLLDYLAEHGLDRNTIVIVTSDHGEEFWEHGGTGHGWSLHQHQLRVPLIIRAPMIAPAGLQIEERAGIIDIYPTVLDMLDLPIPAEVQGRSMLDAIEGSMQQEGERAFLAEASQLGYQKALLSAQHAFLFDGWPPIGERLDDRKRFPFLWRIILRSGGSALYDLDEDPGELRSILADRPEKAAQMQRELLHRIKENLGLWISHSTAERVDLDERTREHLRSLGYIRGHVHIP
jgi:arylsulfatase A-like enzyme